MKVLDLFSGIGGFSLGLEWAGMSTVAFCERDPYCTTILNKHWPDTPVHNDVRNLDGKDYAFPSKFLTSLCTGVSGQCLLRMVVQ